MVKTTAHRRPSLCEDLAQSLRAEIVDGTLPPGTPLQEIPLAERFGVSRTPIREALLLLHREGFVRRQPSVGCSVAELSHEEFSQLFAIVFALETLGLTSARPPTEREQAHLEGLRQVLQATNAIHDAAERAAVRLQGNNAWHLGVVELSGNGELVRLLSQLYERTGRYVTMYWLLRPDLEVDTRVYRRIVEQLAGGDNETAQQELSRHNTAALERIQAALESHFDT